MFAFTTAPVFIRVRASNSVGPGPYSDLAQGPLAVGVPTEVDGAIAVATADSEGQPIAPISAAVSQYNAIRATCKESEFLGSHLAIDLQRCMECPRAAYCGGSGANNVTARDGFWRVPWSKGGLGFSRCYFPPACLGYETFREPSYSGTGFARRRRSLQAWSPGQLSAAEDYLPDVTTSSQLQTLSMELARD